PLPPLEYAPNPSAPGNATICDCAYITENNKITRNLYMLIIYKHPSESALDYLYANWVRKEELERWV
ncbi:MAG TPA: hypothetical protein QGI69_01460, partial [Candidatus Marinimicrobia bacterium]|nr:hypothetical protein [Candidatus Neomarinimicrobiota bacterium]